MRGLNMKKNKNEILVDKSTIIIAKQGIVLKKEDDDWGLLYNPETDTSFALNPVSTLIWEAIKSERSIEDLIVIIRKACVNVPDNMENDIFEYVKHLAYKELAVIVN